MCSRIQHEKHGGCVLSTRITFGRHLSETARYLGMAVASARAEANSSPPANRWPISFLNSLQNGIRPRTAILNHLTLSPGVRSAFGGAAERIRRTNGKRPLRSEPK